MGDPLRPKAVVLPEPDNVLNRIQRGLSGYISYLAACEMNTVFTEYMLYEPILRVMTTRGYKVEPEKVAPDVPPADTGDKPKLDFVAEGHGFRFAVEVKWTDTKTVNVENDFRKLVAFKGNAPGNRAFLLVFGTYKVMKPLKFSKFKDVGLQAAHYEEYLDYVFADLTKTRYGCRLYEVL